MDWYDLRLGISCLQALGTPTLVQLGCCLCHRSQRSELSGLGPRGTGIYFDSVSGKRVPDLRTRCQKLENPLNQLIQLAAQAFGSALAFLLAVFALGRDLLANLSCSSYRPITSCM